MRKLTAIICVLCVLFLCCSCVGNTGTEDASGTDNAAASYTDENHVSVRFSYTESDVARPLAGYAGQAASHEEGGKGSLVFIDVLWSEIEPEEGVYDFSAFDEENHIDEWREQGKHAVLRFECDKPGKTEHMDIPQWLYDKTGDGVFYQSDERHRGYSPNYDNPVFIDAHEKVIAALAEHFSDDNFIAYVELGSLGHWGEWHVYYGSGDGATIPLEPTRDIYVEHYVSAFPDVRLLMRRPFNIAARLGLGLFDDTAGKPRETRKFLQWTEQGGNYSPTEEQNALSPMPDFWKNAPVGGEFNSDISFSQMLGVDLAETVSLLQLCHTTFLGPHYPTANSEENGAGYEVAIAQVEKLLGYHLWITEAAAERQDDVVTITLRWKNNGIAPFYYDWPVELFFYNAEDVLVAEEPVDIALTEIMPEGGGVEASVQIPTTLCRQTSVYVGIKDPMTDGCRVPIEINAGQKDGQYFLFSLSF